MSKVEPAVQESGADPSCILCGQGFSKHSPVKHATQMFDPREYVLACPTMIVFREPDTQPATDLNGPDV